MSKVKLVKPDISYKDQILSYKEEFLAHNDSMDGTAGLIDFENIEDWLAALEANSHEETVRKGFVPASTYLAVRIHDNKLVGMIDIRHRLNDYLKQFGGHIGYSVRPSERCKGYAKRMLGLALQRCIEMDIEQVLITCYKNNTASAKTILHHGGILENEILANNELVQRYWIAL